MVGCKRDPCMCKRYIGRERRTHVFFFVVVWVGVRLSLQPGESSTNQGEIGTKLTWFDKIFADDVVCQDFEWKLEALAAADAPVSLKATRDPSASRDQPIRALTVFAQHGLAPLPCRAVSVWRYPPFVFLRTPPAPPLPPPPCLSSSVACTCAVNRWH